jgi:hypothetical protein
MDTPYHRQMLVLLFYTSQPFGLLPSHDQSGN